MIDPWPDFAENPYASELYARGYVARIGEPPLAPQGWRRLTLKDLHVAHDPRLPGQTSQAGRAELLCLGLLFDVRTPERSAKLCQQHLAESLNIDEDNFLREIDYTCGRYICIYVNIAGVLHVLSDATAMKPVHYYTGEARIISSHVELIARNEPAPRAPTLAFRYGYPGLRTPRSDVLRLSPNMKLDVRGQRATRFWPKRPLPERRLRGVEEAVLTNLNNAMLHIAENFTPVVSVTAGLDSRTTLSTSIKFDNVKYFTYLTSTSSPSMKLDLAFCKTLSTKKVIEIDFISTIESAPSTEFLAVMNENTIGQHSNKLAWEYYNKYAKLEFVHVRSNLAEIGTEFWKNKTFPVEQPLDLARLYLDMNASMPVSSTFRTIDYFYELDYLTNLVAGSKGVDLKSLFYWEFRMAAWHAQVVAESDPTFETVSLFNCRKTLELMLSVDRESRINSLIQKSVIASNAVILTKYSVNGRPFFAA